MKTIQLVNGGKTIVDNKFYKKLNCHKWCLITSGYATRYVWDKQKKSGKTIFMHRLINKTPDGLFTDHINNDKLDNRKDNLRTCTKSQNGFYRKVSKNNRSGVLGIYWNKPHKAWDAKIEYNGQRIFLGRFNSKKDAIEARKQSENRYFSFR